MDIHKLEKILQEYDIESEEDLILALDNLRKGSEFDTTDRKYCLKNNYFLYHKDLPECRKVIEIYKKFYQDRFTKKEFSKYWKGKCCKNPSLATFEKYISCKGCECEYITDGIPDAGYKGGGRYRLKNYKITRSEARIVLCHSLDVKLDDSLFSKKFPYVESFVKALKPVDFKTFQLKKEEKTNKNNKNEKQMTKTEREKLFKIVYVTKKELKDNLDKKDTFEGSDIYLLNLALYAFERGLNEKSLEIVNKLQEKGSFQEDIDFLQLHAKLLSNNEDDDVAIRILENVISIEEPMINPESYNLLAASIKRKAFVDYRNHILTDENFVEKMKKAKELYMSVYAITKNYYPAINIIYLEKLLEAAEGRNKDDVLQKIWEESDIHNALDEDNWWSYISDIEYSILMKREEEVSEKISKLEQKIISGQLDVTDFNIYSTIRQLKFMEEYTVDSQFKTLLVKLEEFQRRLDDKQIDPNQIISE